MRGSLILLIAGLSAALWNVDYPEARNPADAGNVTEFKSVSLPAPLPEKKRLIEMPDEVPGTPDDYDWGWGQLLRNGQWVGEWYCFRKQPEPQPASSPQQQPASKCWTDQFGRRHCQ